MTATPPITMAQEPLASVEHDLVKLRETTGRIVGSVFYGKMFESMRESSTKNSIMHGGRGEEVFSAQFHGILAERMGSRSGRDLGEAMYRRLEEHQRLISVRHLNHAQPSDHKDISTHTNTNTNDEGTKP